MIEPYHADKLVTLFKGRAEDVLPSIADGSVDVFFTSPPYNLGNTTGGGFAGQKLGHYSADAGLAKRGGGGKWNGGSLADGYGGHDDAMPHAEYVAWQQGVLRECWRILKPTGAIFYNHKPRVQDGLMMSPLELNPGLPVRQIIIWARSGGINFAPTHYCPTHEWIVVFAKPAFRLKSRGASGVGDVWSVPQQANSPHPAPFPIGLPARAIETTGAQVVCDPFSGSGTVARACKDAGVKFIGIEREERWCKYTVERMAQECLFSGGAA